VVSGFFLKKDLHFCKGLINFVVLLFLNEKQYHINP